MIKKTNQTKNYKICTYVKISFIIINFTVKIYQILSQNYAVIFFFKELLTAFIENNLLAKESMVKTFLNICSKCSIFSRYSASIPSLPGGPGSPLFPFGPCLPGTENWLVWPTGSQTTLHELSQFCPFAEMAQ